MTKAIKFNLILDGNPVRNLDDLRDNFNIEDILASYRNGLLQRWLEAHGLTEEIGKLGKIPDDDVEAAKALCTAFNSDATKQQIETAAYPFEFRKKEAERLKSYGNLVGKEREIIHAYHEHYTQILSSIEAQSENYPFIKSAVAEIFLRYYRLYLLDSWAFYNRFIKERPLVILAVLANADMRPHIAKELSAIAQDMSGLWSSALARQQHPPKEPQHIVHIQRFAGQTEGYWKDLKPAGKKYLVIRMESGNFIRNAGKNGEELKADDVNGKFPILDGIDYKSNNSAHQLIYMEV